jgi:TrmH family RNA methyltransferase
VDGLITSPSNPRLKLVRKLASGRQRAKLGLFVCEGEDLVAAGLAAGLQPVEALVDAERRAELDGLDGMEEVEPGLLAELSTLAHPPRVIAVFRRADLPRDLDAPAGLALWQVGDPGNVGTLMRTADALGPAFVALSAGCADPTSPKALRASMGAIFRVPTGRFEEAPRPWVGLAPHGGETLSETDLGGRTTFVLGAEREGLPDEVASSCDLLASIPLADAAESLNVAAAGAIALYELTRRTGNA